MRERGGLGGLGCVGEFVGLRRGMGGDLRIGGFFFFGAFSMMNFREIVPGVFVKMRTLRVIALHPFYGT